jgi:hypothetical protein
MKKVVSFFKPFKIIFYLKIFKQGKMLGLVAGWAPLSPACHDVFGPLPPALPPLPQCAKLAPTFFPISPLLRCAEPPCAPAFEFFRDSPRSAPTRQWVAASCPNTFCPSHRQPESFPPSEIAPKCCRLPLLGETLLWVFLLKSKGPASSLSSPSTCRSSPHPPKTTAGSSPVTKAVRPPFPHHLTGATHISDSPPLPHCPAPSPLAAGAPTGDLTTLGLRLGRAHRPTRPCGQQRVLGRHAVRPVALGRRPAQRCTRDFQLLSN